MILVDLKVSSMHSGPWVILSRFNEVSFRVPM
jgi:hypothetical protein